jgi:large subunit ribosomal protein L4
MASVDVLTPAGETAGSVELPDAVFDVQVNVPLIHQVVVGQLAAARQGTSSVKTRADVRGGGKKPYRQKGTGRARQGSIRAPQFTGGGVVHGPTPRDYSQRTPKKMKAAALRGALSDRARGGRVHVVTSLVEGSTPSTKTAAQMLALLSERRHVLVVLERTDQVSWKSLRNLEQVHLLVPDQLNTYDVLVSDDVVFTQGALEAFLAGPAKGKGAKATASDAELSESEIDAAEVTETEAAEAPVKKAAAKAPAEKAPAKKAPAKKAPAEDAGAETAEAPAKKAAAKKAAAGPTAAAKKAAAGTSAAAKKAAPKAETADDTEADASAGDDAGSDA